MKYVSDTDLVTQHHEQVTELMLRISELEADKQRLVQLLNPLLTAAREYILKRRHSNGYLQEVALHEVVLKMQHIDTEGGP